MSQFSLMSPNPPGVCARPRGQDARHVHRPDRVHVQAGAGASQVRRRAAHGQGVEPDWPSHHWLSAKEGAREAGCVFLLLMCRCCCFFFFLFFFYFFYFFLFFSIFLFFYFLFLFFLLIRTISLPLRSHLV